jgi:hypothetical protein
MERRKPLQRRTRLAPGKSLAAGKPLERSGELKRTPLARVGKRRREKDDQSLHAVFSQRSPAARCAVCGTRRWIDPHHVVPLQQLRSYASERGLSREAAQVIFWDVRNRLWTCRQHHSDHESAAERLPLRLLPDEALEFARELGLERLLAKLYSAG